MGGRGWPAASPQWPAARAPAARDAAPALPPAPQPLRLRFALDDPALAGTTSYQWASGNLPLASPGVADKLNKQVHQRVQRGGAGSSTPTGLLLRRLPLAQVLTIQPFDTAALPVFVDGATITVNCTTTAGEASPLGKQPPAGAAQPCHSR